MIECKIPHLQFLDNVLHSWHCELEKLCGIECVNVLADTKSGQLNQCVA